MEDEVRPLFDEVPLAETPPKKRAGGAQVLLIQGICCVVLHFSEHRRKLLLIQFSKPKNFLKSLFIIFIRLLTALWVLYPSRSAISF